MKGELLLINELYCGDEMLDFTSTFYDFGLSLYIDDEHKLEDQLKDTNMLTRGLNNVIDFFTMMEDNEKELTCYQYLRNNVDKIFDNIEYVKFYEDFDVLEFIESNPIIMGKKIVLGESLEISDYDKITKLLTEFDQYKDNIYVSISNNIGYVSLDEAFSIINTIKDEALKISSLNLSPLETVMYTYDLVRNRVYKTEDKDDDPLESRNLKSVLTGDKIVCVGYANIFDVLLKYMGFNSKTVGLTFKDDENKPGHRRNVLYLKDDKYDIDGVYYFDVTWDSKRGNEINEFLNRYTCFAKTRSQMMEIENNMYTYDQFEYYSDDMVSLVKKLLDEEELEYLNKHYVESINYMAKLVDGKNLVNRMCLCPGLPHYNKFDRDELLTKLSILQDKFNKPISAEVFVSALNNVRKLEYYQNDSLYPYTINKLYETYIRSNWEFSTHHYNSEERFLTAIFGKKEIENRDNKKDDFVNYIRNENIGREVTGVKLTKVLQKRYESIKK